MNGKYGWFDSSSKSYNLPEYYSGISFSSHDLYKEYITRRAEINEIDRNLRFRTRKEAQEES